MIPIIKICNKGKGRIVITDLTQDSYEYIDETITDTEPYYENNKFKYSETCTINIIQRNRIGKSETIDTLFTDHSSYLDEQYYDIEQDGHYTIYHCILPTYEWFQKEIEKPDNLTKKDINIYFTDGKQIYNYCNNKIEVVESAVLAIVNTENTTISRVCADEFMIYQLYDCYINLCKLLFNDLGIRCKKSGDFDEITYKRDFLWMTINVLKYQVEFGNFNEAERILEEVNYCGGFCNGSEVRPKQGSGCGCNKRA